MDTNIFKQLNSKELKIAGNFQKKIKFIRMIKQNLESLEV